MSLDNSYKFEAEHPETGETREYDKLNDVLGADIDTDEWDLSKVTA